MKKSLIALAVAGVAVAIPAQAADLKVSGQANVQLVLSNTDDADKRKEKLTPFVKAGDLNVNFAATEEVGFGQAYANVRLDADSLSNGRNGGGNTVTIDNAVVGLKGAFGNVSLGEGANVGGFGIQTADLENGASGAADEAALTYLTPEFVPGLVIGASVVSTENVTGPSNAQVASTQLMQSGNEFGVKYAMTAGFGSISTGVGVSNKEINALPSTGDKEKVSSVAATSVGVKFTSNVGVHVGVTSATDETKLIAAGSKYLVPTANVLSSDGKLKGTRIEAEVGYAAGPVSALVLVNNHELKVDGSSAKEKTDVTRVQVDYALSSAAKVRVRNDSKKVTPVSGTATNSGTTYVELQLAF